MMSSLCLFLDQSHTQTSLSFMAPTIQDGTLSNQTGSTIMIMEAEASVIPVAMVNACGNNGTHSEAEQQGLHTKT